MKMKKGSKIMCVAVTKSDKSEEKLAEELVEEEPVMPEVIEETPAPVVAQEESELL